MDRTGSKKRAREAAAGGIIEQKRHSGGVAPSSKKKKGKKPPEPRIADTSEFFPFLDEELHWAAAATAACGVPEDGRRPPDLFDFPWQKGESLLAPDPEGWGPDLRDVFFSSLVDGCSAAIGIPGDRFSPARSTDLDFPDIGEWWTPELNGVDSIAASLCSKIQNA